MLRQRALIGLVGVGLAGFGVWSLLTTQSPDEWLDVGLWLAVGVIAHDVVISGLVVALGWASGRLPRGVAAAGAVTLVVLGSITLVAVPALIRSQHPQANPTLLTRDYGHGWVLVAIMALLISAVVGWSTGRRTREGQG